MEKQYKDWLAQLNKETLEHSTRVAALCAIIAPKIGLRAEKAEKIGYLHDIGKTYIAPKILKKNGPLTPLERSLIDQHSYIGYEMLREAEEGPEIILPILYHHGFNKTKPVPINESISERTFKYTALLHTVDIYDAMSHKRIYRDALPFEDIKEILEADVMCPKEIIAILTEMESCKMAG